MKPAVFLDRDGTIIEHVHHLCDPDEVRLIPGAIEALAVLRDSGYACVLVTNQSVVGRGKLSIEGLEEIHDVMTDALAAGGAALDGIYYCTVAPQQDDPELVEHPERKPGPMMLVRASRELHLDLAASWMVGDSLSDMLAGRNAGCAGTVLVLTGQGGRCPVDHPAVDFAVADLAAAARLILSRRVSPHGQDAAG